MDQGTGEYFKNIKIKLPIYLMDYTRTFQLSGGLDLSVSFPEYSGSD
jgi:hypothetical protein